MAGPIAAGALRTFTFERPEKANALDAATVSKLTAALRDANADDAPLAIRSEGRAFCGGFDMGGYEEQSHGDLLLRFVNIETLLQALFHSPTATFALVSGAAFGAGADLAAACAYRIGTAQAKFRFPGFRFGVALGTRRLSAIVGADRARAILLEGRTVGAEEALAIGLLTHLVDPSELETTAAALLAAHGGLAPSSAAAILSLTVADTRDADMADLVRSLTPEGLHERIARYRAASR